MKQFRGLLVAVAVLAGLAGAIWWSNKKAEDEKKNPKDSKTRLVQLLEADVVEIQLQRKGEAPLLLRKNTANNRWEMVSEPKYRLDQELVTTLVTNCSTVPTDKVVEDNAADVAQYGLEPGMVTLTLKDKSGKTESVVIGDEAPIGGLYYARKPNERKVYGIAGYQKTGIDKTANDLRDKRLLTVEEAKLSRLELSRKGETLEFGRSAKGDWQLVKPQPARTDTVTVDELFRKAKDTRFDPQLSPEDQKKLAGSFAAAEPVATLRVTDAAVTQSLEVRKSKDLGFLAKASSTDGVHKVPDDLGAALAKPADDFRNKKLLDFGFDDPARIEFKNNGKSTVLEHKGADWLIGGKKMDAATVQPVVDNLRGLSALKFVKSGFTSAFAEVIVTQKDGKTSERLLFAKTGNYHYAKRDGEAAEYEIDPKSFTDLEAAFSQIKEPAAGAPGKK